jgi:hypothetical protein
LQGDGNSTIINRPNHSRNMRMVGPKNENMRKPGSGGLRPNSGRKRNIKGVKVTKHLRLYPPDIALIVAKYGTLQKWADSCIPNE